MWTADVIHMSTTNGTGNAFYLQHIIIHGIIIGCQLRERCAVHLVAAKEIEISNTLCNLDSFPDKTSGHWCVGLIGNYERSANMIHIWSQDTIKHHKLDNVFVVDWAVACRSSPYNSKSLPNEIKRRFTLGLKLHRVMPYATSLGSSHML